MSRRKGVAKPRVWEPLTQRELPPADWYTEQGAEPPDEIWASRLYTVHVRYGRREEGGDVTRDGLLHLSVHRNDRHPVRDWRQLQSIKNEVAGPERLAIELFPPEQFLVDSSNEFHLWVLPADMELPFGLERKRLVMAPEELRARSSQAKQRPFQPGLSTGPEATE